MSHQCCNKRCCSLPKEDIILCSVINKPDNNLLRHKQNEESRLDSKKVKRQKQLENLKSEDVRPTCCNLGPNQDAKWPDYFCNACLLWDNRSKENKRLSWKIKIYTCIAQHTSFLKPTQLNKLSYYDNSISDDDRSITNNEEASIDNPNTEIQITNVKER